MPKEKEKITRQQEPDVQTHELVLITVHLLYYDSGKFLSSDLCLPGALPGSGASHYRF